MFPRDTKKDAPGSGASPGWKALLRADLELTRSRWKNALGVLRASPKIDAALFEELETQLIAADVGTAATHELIARLRKAQRDKRLEDAADLEAELKAALVELLTPLEKPLPATRPKPWVILLAGVNGAGKTTTIAKLTRLFQSQGKFGAARRRRHVPRRSPRAACGMGCAPWCDGDRAGQGRFGGGDLRCDPVGAREGHRRRARRHRGPAADAGAPHGGDPQGEARDGEGRPRRAPRDVARPRRQHGAERGAPGEGFRRGARPHRASSSPSSTAPPRAARSPPSRASIPVPIRFIGIGEKSGDLRPFVAAEFVEALFA